MARPVSPRLALRQLTHRAMPGVGSGGKDCQTTWPPPSVCARDTVSTLSPSTLQLGSLAAVVQRTWAWSLQE
jgi:hypothetical protein